MFALPHEPNELLDHQDDEDEEIDIGATEHTEPRKKKGFGKTEEADIGPNELYKHAVPRWKFDL